MIYIKMASNFGPMVVGISENFAVAGLWFEGQKYFPKLTDVYTIDSFNQMCETLSLTKEIQQGITQTYKKLKTQVEAYEKGSLTDFDITLQPQGTTFQLLVWKLLSQIPFGHTVTYGEIGANVAKIMGVESMSAQAIGGAVGKNPISVIIPCHRVVGAKGSLTGYAGGLDKKSALLMHEGVR